ncbi:MAG: hypothetical protein A2X56_12645 [Nitrospirae bacterium GWC2_57_13]|jgi:hypothetical protein|nr:MAG: hypothetical protein A2X56_12645 [Nitrospirae bacterium GWC2_57_13]HAS53508.1 hypothetical protein [Nitrospiraceae bacterium]
MTHDDIRHKLSEYLDDSLSAEEKSKIEEHLASCAACGNALEELRKALAHVQSLDEVESPPWLTQKIMARVREEAAQKKSIFRRIFYPLSIKLPLQTVAVLFLVVTAYYVYRSMDPAARYREATREFAQQEALPAPRKEPEMRADKPADRSGRLPQSPEYKSLDMKYSYEPPPPVPAEQAPAAAAPEREKLEARPEIRTEGFAAAKAPSALSERAAPEPTAEKLQKRKAFTGLMDADAVRERAAEAPAGIRAIGDVHTPVITYTLHASNIDSAAKDVEKIIERLGGKVARRDAHSIDATVDAGKREELVRQLSRLGRMETKSEQDSPEQKIITVRIQIKGE